MSTATLHGYHRESTRGDALHGGGTCAAATARLNVILGSERNCVRENVAPATAKALSVRRRGDDCDDLPGQRRQRSSLPHSGSTMGNCGQDGVDSPSIFNGCVDEPTSSSNEIVVAATRARREEENTRCSSLEGGDNRAMTRAEAARWLNSSQPASPSSCSMTDVKYLAVTTVGLSDSACGGGDNRPISGRWQPTPVRIRGSRAADHILGGKFPKISDSVETKLVHDSGGEASRSHDTTTTADVTRDDDKTCSTLSSLTSAKSTSGAAVLSQAPNACCRPTNGRRSTTRKPRRDSFSASLQAAINTSSVTDPKQLFQTHREGGDDRSSSAATAATKGPQLQLPRDQQRCGVSTNGPTIKLATLRGTEEQLSGRTLQEGSRPEEVSKQTRATAEAEESRHRQPPSCLEVDQMPPCSSWMNDEEWLQVCLPTQPNKT